MKTRVKELSYVALCLEACSYYGRSRGHLKVTTVSAVRDNYVQKM